MPTVPANQATEQDQALPVHPVLIGSQGGPASVYSVFLAEEKAEAQPAKPVRSLVQVLETDTARPITAKGQGTAARAVAQVTETETALQVTPAGSGSAARGLRVAETTELAQPIAALATGTATKAVGQATEAGAALPVVPARVPARIVRVKASMFPTTRTPETVAIARDTTAVILQVTVLDPAGDLVDLTFPTAVVVVARTARARWEVTPSSLSAAGLLVATLPDGAFHRSDAVDFQIRATYPDGTTRLTRAGRIKVDARL